MDYSKAALLIGMLYAVVWFGRVHHQKQPPEAFLKKIVPENYVKFTGKHLCWRLYSHSSFCSFWGNMAEIDPSINFHGPLAVKQVSLNS